MTSTGRDIYAAAYVAEFDRRYASGLTEAFLVGYPYNGMTAREAWLAWCGRMAMEYATMVAKVFEDA